ncbi:MAG: hypothetical protein LBL73_09985 [Synergistaceae bacterium]|nr:hypothetical protein [Synergistaceae bacterium]
MHAYSTLFTELHGLPKGPLVHELSMLLLAKRVNGAESPEEVYAGYKELCGLFSSVIED